MRKWLRWIVGGNGRPSLWTATWNWKLYTFKGEISWWEYVKPLPTNPVVKGLREKALEHGQRLDTDIIHDPIEGFDSK